MSIWYSTVSRCLNASLGRGILWLWLCWLSLLSSALAGALEDYVSHSDPYYNWKRTEAEMRAWGTVNRLELVSQHWRNQFWSHHLLVIRPNEIRNPAIGFLLIAGDEVGEKDIDTLRTLAERAGAITAVITNVPNQPLYDGHREDALVAYTFEQYLKTSDETWPLLFPMVKSAVRGMDTVQAFVHEELGQQIEEFVVAGASKRGWATWLTAAVDPRVKGIAPMVIDMLNMKAQLQWAEKVYGKQSENISDYTNLNLHQKLDDPPMQKLRSWVGPLCLSRPLHDAEAAVAGHQRSLLDGRFAAALLEGFARAQVDLPDAEWGA